MLPASFLVSAKMIKTLGRFLRDDRGSELAEYALVLSVFAVASILTVQLIASTANSRVETDETNYSGAFVNGY